MTGIGSPATSAKRRKTSPPHHCRERKINDLGKLNDPGELRKFASWYREFAERAGNPAVWVARLRTAEALEREASQLEDRSDQSQVDQRSAALPYEDGDHVPREGMRLLRIPMYNIANTLPAQIRLRSVARLNRHLAAAIYLHALVKQAHPNVRLPTIIAFDELFEKVADALKEYSDKIAERAGTLAGRRMAAPSLLEPFNGIPQGPDLTVGQRLGNNVADRERVVSKTTRDRHASAL